MRACVRACVCMCLCVCNIFSLIPIRCFSVNKATTSTPTGNHERHPNFKTNKQKSIRYLIFFFPSLYDVSVTCQPSTPFLSALNRVTFPKRQWAGNRQQAEHFTAICRVNTASAVPIISPFNSALSNTLYLPCPRGPFSCGARRRRDFADNWIPTLCLGTLGLVVFDSRANK